MAQIIGGYTLEEKVIGEGADSFVYKGVDNTGQERAIKVLKSSLYETEEGKVKIDNYTKFATHPFPAELKNHPFLSFPESHGFTKLKIGEETVDRFYLVYALMENDLARIRSTKRLNPKKELLSVEDIQKKVENNKWVKFCYQTIMNLAEAIGALHTIEIEGKPLYHRDVRLENILEKDGDIKLADLDFEVINPVTTMTTSGVPSYISSLGAEFFIRTKQGPWMDIFGWGKVAYEILTGREYVSDVKLIHELNTYVSEDVSKIIHWALSKSEVTELNIKALREELKRAINTGKVKIGKKGNEKECPPYFEVVSREKKIGYWVKDPLERLEALKSEEPSLKMLEGVEGLWKGYSPHPQTADPTEMKNKCKEVLQEQGFGDLIDKVGLGINKLEQDNQGIREANKTKEEEIRGIVEKKEAFIKGNQVVLNTNLKKLKEQEEEKAKYLALEKKRKDLFKSITGEEIKEEIVYIMLTEKK